ncbi:PadR family transcriptional regulator [Pseudoduganella umbonata]|uniref:PadR family transcriptional regulator n=1 Tax=Pseudoduganella umbonata TaxID=864828 RepID=A0A4P8HPC9_9BURK|nr:PadR family transcriptional regulator [Pseudoduganella umbonata]MBB3220988.1 DNA-binding PadR family transcriptional regulator [Pseudoduganella umbonata]QCP11569.1 PadR family transcriptional regulator [Pseudoduganella umbonata]
MFHKFRHHGPRSHESHHPRGGHGGGPGAPGGRGPRMFDAGAMRYVVLQLIAEKPRHGYDIIKELEGRVGGGYAPSPGAIYPLMAMLYEMGHVSISSEGNKKLHSITPEGQAFLDENRQMVDALMARLAEPQAGSRDSLRSVMHELKHVVIEKGRDPAASPARAEQIAAILRRAADEIRQLA